MTAVAAVVLLLTPLVAYPLAATALVVVDSLAGERLFLYLAAYERRLLLDTFLADYRASLPVALLLSLLLMTLGLLARRWRGDVWATPVSVIGGGAAGFCGALVISGAAPGATHVALTGAGAVHGLVVAMGLRLFTAPRARSVT